MKTVLTVAAIIAVSLFAYQYGPAIVQKLKPNTKSPLTGSVVG